MREERKTDCLTISVPEAGRRYFGLSRNGSYEAATRGEIPTIRIGRKLRVPVVALERMLEEAHGGASLQAAPATVPRTRQETLRERNPAPASLPRRPAPIMAVGENGRICFKSVYSRKVA